MVIEAGAERERQSIIGRVSAICRAFTKHGSPLQGLRGDDQDFSPISKTEAVRRWLFAEDD